MTVIPPALKKGDTIGIVCPAGFMPKEKVETCINTLKQWGFEVIAGATVGLQNNYFAGTDEERLYDLQTMLDNTSIKAILCARGGYGTGRIIDRLNFKYFIKHPKWIIGFSDITVLHCHLFSRFKIASLHAPMAAAFNNDEHDNPYVQSLLKALTGEKAEYKIETYEANIQGNAKGKLVGGNLYLLVNLIGTPSETKTKGKILFIEDVGEYLYNLDRMLYQFKRNGKFDELAGLVVGSFNDMKDTTVPFGNTAYEIIRDIVKDYSFPVCYNFPVGHARENYALKVGASYKLHVGKKKVILQEL